MGNTTMAGVLLALFPVLLMVNTRAALGDIALAIVLLYRKRTNTARRIARRPHADNQI